MPDPGAQRGGSDTGTSGGGGPSDTAEGFYAGHVDATAQLAGALADAIEAGQATGGTVGTAAQEDVANLSDAQDGQDAASPSLDAMGSGMEGYGQGWGYGVDPSGYSYGGYGSGLVGGSPGLISKGRTDQEGTGYYDNLIGSSKQSGRVDQEGMGYYDNLVGSARPSGRVDQEGTGYDPVAGYTPPPGWGSAATPTQPGVTLDADLGIIALETQEDITAKGKAAEEAVAKDAKYHTKAYADLAKGYMETLDALRGNPQGKTFGINNTTLANAYSTMDQTMKAFTVVHGPSKFGKFVGYLANAMVPGLSALKAVENSLIAKGMYDKTTGQAMLAQVAAAIASGDHLQGGGGEDQEEDSISNFIRQYPWAEGLDPNYIKYLIENPQELQKLLTGEAEI